MVLKRREGRANNFFKIIKAFLAIAILIAGIAAVIYFGLYVMFIKAIMVARAAFDAGTLTDTLVGWTVIKCLLASTVEGIIIAVSAGISKALCK